LIDFHQNWQRRNNTQSKKEFVGGQHRSNLPHLPPKTPILGQEVLKIHANINNPISALNVYANRRNFCVFKEIAAEEHDGDVRFKTGGKMWLFRASNVTADCGTGKLKTKKPS